MASPLRSLSAPTLLSLAIAIGLGGCAGLPDQRLANEALKRGDTALAEQNYRQLADLGYSVNYAAADAYALSNVSAQGLETFPIVERLIMPDGVVDGPLHRH